MFGQGLVRVEGCVVLCCVVLCWASIGSGFGQGWVRVGSSLARLP